MVSQQRVAQLGLLASFLVLTLSMSVLVAGTLKPQPLRMNTGDEPNAAMPPNSARIAMVDM